MWHKKSWSLDDMESMKQNVFILALAAGDNMDLTEF
jgi:hypothetical protein